MVLAIEDYKDEKDTVFLKKLIAQSERKPEIKLVDFSDEQSVKEAMKGCQVIFH